MEELLVTFFAVAAISYMLWDRKKQMGRYKQHREKLDKREKGVR